MKVAIFSDLHLSRTRRTEHEAWFVTALRQLRASHTAELWLLGDIFDLMVGPFEFWVARHPDFFEELEAWHREKRVVVWVQGNHDFFLDGLLSKRGVIVSDDFVERRFGKRRIYLAHGDLINVEDQKYLSWRAFTRNKWARTALRLIPPFVRSRLLLNLGTRLSDQSRSQSRDEGRENLEELYAEFARQKWVDGYTGVCLGHSHVESFIESDAHFSVNLGSWVNYSPRCALWNSEEYKLPERVLIRDNGLSK